MKPRPSARTLLTAAISLFLMFSAGIQAADAPRSDISSRPLNPASQQTITVLDQEVAFAASQAAIGGLVPDVALLDRNGQPRRLRDFRGKPLLVHFMYTACFQVCPTSTRNLQKALDAVVARHGLEGFNIVSIGFNQPNDTPAALKAFANQHGLHLPNWELLSPPPVLVPELTEAFGFRFVQTVAGFDHLNQITLVDANSRIVRQIYGTTFSSDDFSAPLAELAAGKPLQTEARPLAELIDKVVLLCSRYDPQTGRYRFDYRIALEFAGILTFALAMAWFVWQERHHGRSH
jgi:protein SCO1/2